MKAAASILLLALCSIECRKVVKPIDKNANIDFINMEGGGVKYGGSSRPGQIPAQGPTMPVPAGPAPIPITTKQPIQAPTVGPTTTKPVVQTQPHQIKPIPVNPIPAARPITTPGPGNVQQLVNFYDSQGKGSPIRPYSYSQAVKQG